jgi:hypothetical protein
MSHHYKRSSWAGHWRSLAYQRGHKGVDGTLLVGVSMVVAWRLAGGQCKGSQRKDCRVKDVFHVDCEPFQGTRLLDAGRKW